MSRLFAFSAIALAALAAALPANAQSATTANLTLTLESAGNIERNIVTYQCDD